MKAELISRLEKLEARHGVSGVARRIEGYRIVGINPDGTEGQSVAIKIQPIMKNGRVDFSKVPDDELRQIARLRIVEAD
jgi:predicted RNA-binding protein with TRAM domain